jgi:hypothetical protein
MGATEKSITESVGPDPTLAPMTGSKRAASQNDSTTPRSGSVVLGSSGTLSRSDATFSFPFCLSYALQGLFVMQSSGLRWDTYSWWAQS